MTSLSTADPQASASSGRRLVQRHAFATRITHWINALCRPAFKIGAETSSDGAQKGFARLGLATFDTTGKLGLIRNADGDFTERAFPRWATIPGWRSLTLGRRWHFFFAWFLVANLVAYYIFGLINGHLRRDLVPTRQQLHPREILADIVANTR
jgi:thiosulfate reductase cytochrome b subunit